MVDHRDRAAARRDRAAEDRDRDAASRDCLAEARDRLAAAQEQPAGDREAASRDRADALSDRERAAHDRSEAAGDREHAGLDALTGALRRERGMVDLDHEIDRARRSDGRLVLAFVDIDALKATNDAHGHPAGDQLLRDTAAALRTGLRSYDLVVRYGGDEFLCALPGSDIEGARRRFRHVARRLAERTKRGSVSLGLAALDSADTLDDLVARADTALYAGRRAARGHVPTATP